MTRFGLGGISLYYEAILENKAQHSYVRPSNYYVASLFRLFYYFQRRN